MKSTVDAIVRGPQPYFGTDGILYMPGQIVRGVPADEVGENATVEVEAEFEAKNGDLRKRMVPKHVPFAPLVDDGASVTAGSNALSDRLNVTDFLKQGENEIIAAIVSGSVDDHLAVIEQQEIARKGPARKALIEAVAERLAAR